MVLVIAHRGARFEAPENTLPGFRHANALAVEAVEFDVRLTRDDQLVVIHDATVDRTTDGTGAVADLTLAELRSLDARADFPDWPEPAGIPTLAEVLATIDPRRHLMIEIKRDRPEREERIAIGIRDALAATGRPGGATISSFDPAAIAIAATVAPTLPRGLIGDWDDEQYFEVAATFRCAQADIHLPAASVEAIEAARAGGLVTTAWPCNDVDALDQAITLGFDQICTDRPTWLLRELAARRVSPDRATG